ncbi:MAG TPA: hypothetical protein VGR28_06565 [Candidatus Thermoplasmatota archaeon]|jgi:hypothetical protein|nr:hypothetical protein [Candidatus Thermoplasmatota archaeon]
MTAQASCSRGLAAAAALALLLPGAVAQQPDTPVGATTTSVTLDPPSPALDANNTTAINVTISYTYTRAGALGGASSTDIDVTANVTGPAGVDPTNVTVEVPVEAGGVESNTTTATVDLRLSCTAPGAATLSVTARAADNGLLEPSEGTATASVRCMEAAPAANLPGNNTNLTGNLTGNVTLSGNMSGNLSYGNGTEGSGETNATGQANEQGRIVPPAPAALGVLAVAAVGLALRRRRRGG